MKCDHPTHTYSIYSSRHEHKPTPHPRIRELAHHPLLALNYNVFSTYYSKLNYDYWTHFLHDFKTPNIYKHCM